MDDDFTFDFEAALEPQQPAANSAAAAAAKAAEDAVPKPRNYRMTVCTYWLRNLCMKGDTCGFLHQFDPSRMPVCRNLLKFGQCKEPDCPYKHTTEEIKECNMYKLGFCIYGPACRFKHTRLTGPPPDPETLEACKPKEFRNINIVANQANEGILPAQDPSSAQFRPRLMGPGGANNANNRQMVVSQQQGGGGGGQQRPGQRHLGSKAPKTVDQSLLAAVGQHDLRYGF